MTRVDEINAQIAKLEAERERAMLAEYYEKHYFAHGLGLHSLSNQ